MLVKVLYFFSWCLKNKDVIILGAIGSIIATIIISIFVKVIFKVVKKLFRFVNRMFHIRTKAKRISSVTTIVPVSPDSNNDIDVVSLPVVPYIPTTFFHYRLTDAFPCLNNGITEFSDRRTIIKRLETLLAEPLTFSADDSRPGFDSHPIWWFRGTYNLWIDRFHVLNRRKVLINIDEYVVTKLIVYKSMPIYRDFIYVECNPDKPSGAYKHTKQSIERDVQEYGFCQEEFGLFKNRVITRREYDEGSTLTRGTPTVTSGVELRTRVLTKYNFIIAAKYSPYNSNTFDRYSEEYFNKLLTNQIDFNEFLVWMLSLDRNPMDMVRD